MMKYSNNRLFSTIIIVVLLSFTGSLLAADLTQKLTTADCRIIDELPAESGSAVSFSDALLWKVTREDLAPSYIFGTIHMSDPVITDLPEPVKSALGSTATFVMEALPTPEDALLFSKMMFYADGTSLKQYLDEELFNLTAEVLSNFHLPIETVAIMKPWAAFVVMNYPADNTMPLDLKLYELALDQGDRTVGLETLSEQVAVFNEIALDRQLRLLLDTVCNYNSFDSDIEVMKRLYLNKDLAGLLNISTKHPYAHEPVYAELNKRLLTDRNTIMVERIQPVLEKGDAFIAVGALHLPGEDGVIARLDQLGYKITAIY